MQPDHVKTVDFVSSHNRDHFIDATVPSDMTENSVNNVSLRKRNKTNKKQQIEILSNGLSYQC